MGMADQQAGGGETREEYLKRINSTQLGGQRSSSPRPAGAGVDVGAVVKGLLALLVVGVLVAGVVIAVTGDGGSGDSPSSSDAAPAQTRASLLVTADGTPITRPAGVSEYSFSSTVIVCSDLLGAGITEVEPRIDQDQPEARNAAPDVASAWAAAAAALYTSSFAAALDSLTATCRPFAMAPAK